jgi:hypothetical protein
VAAMIEPDLTGRCPQCDAGLGQHFEDCPTVLPDPRVDLDAPAAPVSATQFD